jgi:hypothetical protein
MPENSYSIATLYMQLHLLTDKLRRKHIMVNSGLVERAANKLDDEVDNTLQNSFGALSIALLPNNWQPIKLYFMSIHG